MEIGGSNRRENMDEAWPRRRGVSISEEDGASMFAEEQVAGCCGLWRG